MQYRWFFVPEVGHDFQTLGLQEGTREQAAEFLQNEVRNAWAGDDRQHYLAAHDRAVVALNAFLAGKGVGAVIYLEYGSWVVVP